MVNRLIGERLKQLREGHGYSREKLAEILEISANPIYQYETERSDPSSEIVGRIAKHFNVSVDYLLGLTDDPIPHISEQLSEKERLALAAWRSGEKYEAIRVIVNDE